MSVYSVFSMDHLALVISLRKNILVDVQHTGGGVATLFTYAQVPDTQVRTRVISAGPGSYDHPDFGKSVAEIEEFYFGPYPDEEGVLGLDACELKITTVNQLASAILVAHYMYLAGLRNGRVDG